MKFIELLIICGFFLACSTACRAPEKNQHSNLIKLNGIAESNTPYQVRQVIPLETTPENLLGDYLIVKAQENNFFIYDENSRNAIHRFDNKGRYHGKVVEVGEGPGMVTNILDFVPTESGLEVLVGMGDFAKIAVFDESFELDKEITLDYQGSSFEKLPDGGYVLSGSYNLPFIEHRIVIVNADGKLVKEFLPNDYENQMMPMQERNFFKEGGKLFFHEAFNPTAYEVREDSLEVRFQFDFGKYAIPTEFWERNIMEGFEMINNNGFASIYSYCENESKAFFEIYVQHSGVRNHQVIWDKEREKASQRIFTKEQNPAFYSPIGLIDNKLVFIAQAAYVSDAGIAAEGINKDDNPVLLFVDFE